MKPTKQQELILEYDGNSVVIAAPGSGKTFVIASKIKSNLKNLLEHQGVIAISYTNKASNELKARSLSNGENPLSSFFGTIDRFNLSEIVIPFGKHLFGLPKKDIQITKIELLPEDEQKPLSWIDRTLTLANLKPAHIDTFKELFLHGIILIESIGLLANYIFTNSLACRNYITAKYKFLYIDEYQDSGPEQHQLFLKVKELGIKAIAVGDLNQSIYAFSGKDARYLQELNADDDFKHFKLDKNHRCHPGIINYSNYLLNPKTELIETDQNPIFFYEADGNEGAVANFIDGIIDTFKKEYDIKRNNQIAILTRLKRTAEIINAELKAPHHYSETNELDKNLNVWSAIFSNLLHFLFDPGYKFTEAIEFFVSYDSFSRAELLKLNLLKKELESMRDNPLGSVEVLITTLQGIALIIAPNSAKKEPLKLLRDVLNNPFDIKGYYPTSENDINILTLHKSKGLEYDLVIHVDLVEWVFPKKKPGPNNDFNNPIYPEWTQDLNLHYVGITRARKACLLMASNKRTNYENVEKNGKPSEFITLNGIQKLTYKFDKDES